MKFWHWLRNLPWHLIQILICDLIGHKPMLDMVFVPNLTVCERCMAPLKFRDGEWSGDFAINDLLNYSACPSLFDVESRRRENRTENPSLQSGEENMTQRINVRGHYRSVTRDPEGKFTGVRKWQGRKNLCCCCGLFPATEPNGLCKDCADNCAGFLLKDKPCLTINHRETTGE